MMCIIELMYSAELFSKKVKLQKSNLFFYFDQVLIETIYPL
jgi:hypothetical protein